MIVEIERRTGKRSFRRRQSARIAMAARTHSNSKRKWSARVTESSDALTLKDKVFKQSPAKIATSLKNSAEHSRRRKSSPFRSAMSMLTFYINRAGKNLSAPQRKRLDAAKQKLREAFGRTPR
jgi:hypothetical protein